MSFIEDVEKQYELLYGGADYNSANARRVSEERKKAAAAEREKAAARRKKAAARREKAAARREKEDNAKSEETLKQNSDSRKSRREQALRLQLQELTKNNNNEYLKIENKKLLDNLNEFRQLNDEHENIVSELSKKHENEIALLNKKINELEEQNKYLKEEHELDIQIQKEYEELQSDYSALQLEHDKLQLQYNGNLTFLNRMKDDEEIRINNLKSAVKSYENFNHILSDEKKVLENKIKDFKEYNKMYNKEINKIKQIIAQ